MQVRTLEFRQRAREATSNETLRRALDKARDGFVAKRASAVQGFPAFDDYRSEARRVKDYTLSRLDEYLEQFERTASAAGTRVHWAATPEEARSIVRGICRDAGARVVTKGKTMVGEEVNLNEALEEDGLDVVETDLGEYIIQLAHEPPSHIIAPAVHKTREEITALFAEHHHSTPRTEVAELVNEARQVLRQRYLDADVGITGANLLIAESGATAIVTNEGNGDLTASLPRVHVQMAGIDKLVPTWEDASTVLRVLARSATGQDITSYTSFFTGPRRESDGEGPEEHHIVLVDNGRSEILATEFRSMLRCIRCGACMNHCPVYASIGGHPYGWVYPGPMGSVLSPLMLGIENAPDHPRACTLNGRCGSVCPVEIPLPDHLRRLREMQFEGGIVGRRYRWGIALWAWLASRPGLYQRASRIGAAVLHRLGGRRGRTARLPAGGGWTSQREFPTPPAGGTFMARWQRGDRAPRGNRQP